MVPKICPPDQLAPDQLSREELCFPPPVALGRNKVLGLQLSRAEGEMLWNPEKSPE